MIKNKNDVLEYIHEDNLDKIDQVEMSLVGSEDCDLVLFQGNGLYHRDEIIGEWSETDDDYYGVWTRMSNDEIRNWNGYYGNLSYLKETELDEN